MLKTFFEKVPVKDGDVLINYTSTVKDATLERLYRYTITRFGTNEVISEQEDLTSLIQARKAAWSNLGNMVKPLTPIAVHETDDEATEEILDEDGLYNTIYDQETNIIERESLSDWEPPCAPHDEKPLP